MEIGDVRAGNQKDDSDDDEQHEGVSARDGALHKLDERHHLHLTVLICCRVGVRQMAGEKRHLRLCLGEVCAGFELCDDMERSAGSIYFFLWRQREGNPQIRGNGEFHAFVHHADDRERPSVDADTLAKDSRVCPEVA